MIKHVAFIMDGNRRWAKARLLPLIAGHTKGYQAIEPLINYAIKKEIKHLTFWAFSTENWHRDKKEVEVIIGIFRHLFQSDLIKRLQKNGVKICVLGELAAFPKDIVLNVKKIITETEDNTSITVNIGLNYGGRAEILRAVNSLLKTRCHAESHRDLRLVSASPQEISKIPLGLKQVVTPVWVQDDNYNITEEEFSQFLYTKNQPDPDLIIRTSGEQRLSGFLPWQSVYSELYFPEIYWPDFNETQFEKALEEFAKRKRRFGQ